MIKLLVKFTVTQWGYHGKPPTDEKVGVATETWRRSMLIELPTSYTLKEVVNAIKQHKAYAGDKNYISINSIEEA